MRKSIFDEAREIITSRGKDIIEREFGTSESYWSGDEFWTTNPTRGDKTIGSFSIKINGVCADFAADCPADIIGLINHRLGEAEGSKKGAEYIVENYGVSKSTIVAKQKPIVREIAGIKTPPENSLPSFPVEPDLMTEYIPGFIVARWDKPDGKKDIRPRIFDGKKWIGKRPRLLPLYRPMSVKHHDGPVLVVEGEKCVHIAEGITEGTDAKPTTWHGGAKAIKSVDFAPLAEKDIILWPDQDSPGRSAMQYIERYSKAKRVAWVDISGMGASEDIADVDPELAKKMILDAIKRLDAPVPTDEPVTKEDFSGYSTLDRIPTADEVADIVDEIRFRTGKKSGDLSTFEPASELLDLDPDFRWLVRYDEATAGLVHSPKYKNIDEVYIATLNRCKRYGMSISMQTRRDLVDTIALRPENRFNSVLELIEGIEKTVEAEDIEDILDVWMMNFVIDPAEDGFNPITAEGWIDWDNKDEPRRRVVGAPIPTKYLHREIWRIWWTRHLCHLLSAFTDAPIPMDIVPILVGAQGTGKSTLCRALALEKGFFADFGDKVGMDLGSPNSIRQIIGKIVGELGEMVSIKKQDVDSIKSFISGTEDSYTQKFKEGTTTVRRTCALFGTSNPEQFLQDLSGNRRFFPMRIKVINPELTLGRAGREVVKTMYASFAKKAREILADGWLGVAKASKMSEALSVWIESARDRATDMPVVVEDIQRECLAIEACFAKNGGAFYPGDRRLKYLTFATNQISELVYGGGNSRFADRNFGRHCDKVLSAMGYEKSVVRCAGLTTRGWKKLAEKCIADHQARKSDDEATEEARASAGALKVAFF